MFVYIFVYVLLQALSCLVQIASVRRTLFSNEERAKFLSQLVNGVRNILQNPQVGCNSLKLTYIKFLNIFCILIIDPFLYILSKSVIFIFLIGF